MAPRTGIHGGLRGSSASDSRRRSRSARNLGDVEVLQKIADVGRDRDVRVSGLEMLPESTKFVGAEAIDEEERQLASSARHAEALHR